MGAPNDRCPVCARTPAANPLLPGFCYPEATLAEHLRVQHNAWTATGVVRAVLANDSRPTGPTARCAVEAVLDECRRLGLSSNPAVVEAVTQIRDAVTAVFDVTDPTPTTDPADPEPPRAIQAPSAARSGGPTETEDQ